MSVWCVRDLTHVCVISLLQAERHWEVCLLVWCSRACLHSMMPVWLDWHSVVLLEIRTGARPGVNNPFKVFNKELNARNSLWLTCLGRRGRELCVECTISWFIPVAVVTGAHRRVNVCSPRLTAEEQETFRDVGGLMSVTTDSAHAKLYLDLSVQHTNMWYFYNPDSQNKPVSELFSQLLSNCYNVNGWQRSVIQGKTYARNIYLI